mmetsp:Transcript_10370/g.21038  ORF Transcript_10370/g.21038 Transcript_10370/m.21038 type:complete len:230 (-) Transcript_10370:118-807(-)
MDHQLFSNNNTGMTTGVDLLPIIRIECYTQLLESSTIHRKTPLVLRLHPTRNPATSIPMKTIVTTKIQSRIRTTSLAPSFYATLLEDHLLKSYPFLPEPLSRYQILMVAHIALSSPTRCSPCPIPKLWPMSMRGVEVFCLLPRHHRRRILWHHGLVWECRTLGMDLHTPGTLPQLCLLLLLLLLSIPLRRDLPLNHHHTHNHFHHHILGGNVISFRIYNYDIGTIYRSR